MKEMFCLTCFFDNFGYRLQTLVSRPEVKKRDLKVRYVLAIN